MCPCMTATKYNVRGETAIQHKEVEVSLVCYKRTNRKYVSQAMTQSVSHKSIGQASNVCIDHIEQ